MITGQPFRDLVTAQDARLFELLSDTVEIAGKPCQGMFSAPWLAPQLGQLTTGLLEPHLVIREENARTISTGTLVSFSALDYTVVGIEPDSTGLTVLLLRPLD